MIETSDLGLFFLGLGSRSSFEIVKQGLGLNRRGFREADPGGLLVITTIHVGARTCEKEYFSILIGEHSVI